MFLNIFDNNFKAAARDNFIAFPFNFRQPSSEKNTHSILTIQC